MPLTGIKPQILITTEPHSEWGVAYRVRTRSNTVSDDELVGTMREVLKCVALHIFEIEYVV